MSFTLEYFFDTNVEREREKFGRDYTNIALLSMHYQPGQCRFQAKNRTQTFPYKVCTCLVTKIL